MFGNQKISRLISVMVAIYIVLFSLLAFPVLALKLPSYIKPCNRNDPKVNECVVKNGRAAIPYLIHGDPKYGLPDLDPFTIEEVKVRQGTKQVGLSLTMTKPKLYGLGDTDFYKASVDFEKNHVKWDFRNKALQMIGPYKAKGKVLLLPITGEGIANLTVRDNMNQFLNENWKEMFKAIAPEMITTLDTVFRSLLNKVSGLVPFDEVYLSNTS